METFQMLCDDDDNDSIMVFSQEPQKMTQALRQSSCPLPQGEGRGQALRRYKWQQQNEPLHSTRS